MSDKDELDGLTMSRFWCEHCGAMFFISEHAKVEGVITARHECATGIWTISGLPPHNPDTEKPPEANP